MVQLLCFRDIFRFVQTFARALLCDTKRLCDTNSSITLSESMCLSAFSIEHHGIKPICEPYGYCDTGKECEPTVMLSKNF